MAGFEVTPEAPNVDPYTGNFGRVSQTYGSARRVQLGVRATF